MNEITSITGRYVSRLNAKYNSDYCINRIYIKTNDNLPIDVINKMRKGKGWEITVTGYNLPTTKAKYFGEWIDTKYGKQFKASTYEFVTPDTKKGLVGFLSSKQFKGIGKKIAQQIVDEFGMQSLDVIKNEPHKLLIIRGMNLNKINLISSKLKATEYYNKLAVFLNTYGSVESSKIMKIANQFGDEALETIQENPYAMTEVEGIGFTTADTVAKAMAQKVELAEDVKRILGCYQRISSAIIFMLKENSIRTGGTFTEYKDIFNMTYNLLNNGFISEIVSSKELSEAFQKMANSKEIAFFKVNGKYCVLDADSNRDEREIAVGIKRLLSVSVSEQEKEAYVIAFQNIEAYTSIPFSSDQREAIQEILCSNVAILNGGPGTGKSTCLKAIIDCYKAVKGKGAKVTQVAPTGKAARRMTESTGLPADTIHRTCGIYTNTDLKNGGREEIPAGLVICDETSMVDTSVMRCLLNKIDWKNSKVILVGDSDQLPSVGAGSVLHDLIDSKVIPTYKLTVNHRQADGAGIIIENARKMNTGNCDLVYDKDRFSFIPANDEAHALSSILHVYDEEVKKWGIDNVAILCPRRQSTPSKQLLVCVDNINAELQNIVNPKVNGDMSITIGRNEFRVRDRVIQMKNTEFASNGDVGVIKSIAFEQNDDDDDKEMIITIDFENGNICHYSAEDMMNVSLAYALTIHKSQGSEYKSVIMPFIIGQKCPLFQRNLIYTGATRSKEKCTIVGSKEAVNLCIKTNEANRNTLLKERLIMCKRKEEKEYE